MGKWNNDYQYHNDSWSVKNNWKKSSRNDYRNSSWHKSDRPRSYWRSESYGSNDNDTVSKWLTWVLRHGASEEDVHMNKHGYVSVDELIALREKEHGKTTNLYQIRLVVETCPKQRFELWEDEETSKAYVRATQGHSISKVQDSVHRPLRNAEDLGNEEPVHGTFLHSWLKIRNEGLKTMGRNHIHMCMGLPGTGVISGMREDADVAIYINVAMAMKSGVSFVQSSNGVILTTGEGDTQTLSTRYFSRVLWLAPSSEHVLIWSCERGDLLEQVRKENEELELALGRAEWEKPKKPAAKKMPMPKKMPESLQRPGAMRPPEPEVPPSNLAPTMCKAASPGVPPLPPPPPPIKEHIHGLEEAPWRQNYPQIQDGSNETPRRPGMQPENVSKSEKWPKEQDLKDQWPERSEGHDVRRFLQGQTEEHNSKWDQPWQEGWERSVPSRPPVQKPPVPPPAKHDGQNFFLKEHRSKWDQPWQDGWELSMPSRSSVGDLPVAPPPKKEKAPDRHWDSWNEPDSPQNPNHVPLPNWARVDQSSRMIQEGAAPRSEMGYHNERDSKHHNMTSAMVPHASSSAAGNLQPNERPVRHQQHDEQWHSDVLAQKRFDNLPAPRSEMGYHNESDSKHHNMTSAMVPHASSSAAANLQADVRNSQQKEQQWHVSNSLPQNTQPHVPGLQSPPAPYLSQNHSMQGPPAQYLPQNHSNDMNTQYQQVMQQMTWCYYHDHQKYQAYYPLWTQWIEWYRQQQQMVSKQPAASLSHHSEEKKQKDEAQLSREHMDILNHSNKCQAQQDASRSIPSQDVEKSQMGVGLVREIQNGDRRINSQEPAIVTSQAALVPYQVSDSESSDSESESDDKSIDRSSDREKDDTELRSKLTQALSPAEAEEAEKAEREQARLAEKMQQEEAEAKRRKAEEEAEAKRRKAEEEAEAERRKAEDAARAKRKKEAEDAAEAKRKKEAEEEAEAKRKKAEDAARAKRKKEAEEEAEAKRRKAEEEAEAKRRKAEDAAEAQRKKAEDAAEAKRKKEAEDAEEAKRRKAEEDPAEEKQKKAAEDAAEPKRRKAEEDPAEEKQKKAAEAKQRKAKQEDRRNREERRLRAEHEKRNQETPKNEVGEQSPQKTESVAKDTKVEKKEEQDVETVKSSAKAEFLNQKLEEAKNSQKESTVTPNGSSKVSEGVQERRIEPEAKIGELKKILQSKKIAKQKEETEKAPKSGKVKLVKLDSDEEVQTSPPKDKKSKSQDDRFHSPPARAAKPKKKAQLSSARHVLLKEARSPSNERSENSGHHQASHSNHSKRRREPSRHRKSASRRARSKRRRDSSHRSSPSRREPRRSRSKERSDSSSSSTSNSEEKRKKAARAAKAKKTKVDKVAQSTQKQQKEAAETAKKTKGKVDQSPRRSSKGKEKPSKEEKRKVKMV